MVTKIHYITHTDGCSGYTYWIFGEVMPRIHDQILNCSIYLYETVEDANSGEKTGGSGFIVGVPSSIEGQGGYLYAVTNSHVIREGNSPIIRINTKADKFDVYESGAKYWYHHPSGDDLAILPLSLDITRYKLKFIDIRLFIGASMACRLVPATNWAHIMAHTQYIGPGDEVFIIGRFIGYDGKQMNEPIVRFGTLSIGHPVKIEHARGYMQESYLVESHSLSGFSGSPVFITPGGNSLQLLGIDWGHKYTDEYVREKNGDICSEGWKIRTNSGISCIVPAWKLAELLNIEELVNMRKKKDTETGKRLKENRRKKVEGTALDTLTKKEFYGILDKASQPIKHEAESDSKQP